MNPRVHSCGCVSQRPSPSTPLLHSPPGLVPCMPPSTGLLKLSLPHPSSSICNVSECAHTSRVLLLYWIVFEIFESLHSEINHFQAQSSVLICGDLNARTGSLPEYTTDNGNNYIFGQSFSKNIVNFPINNTDDQVNINREASD